ncbi:MAG: fibronectin type III domain-containing protein [Eubacterium sp.]|nr:fibronectin type III domain-containing protein [Eubacterium sp.]MCI2197766.1 fibronectin type III domain-containing protein [Eubacterium sp.]
MVKKKLAVLGLAAVMTVAFMPAMAFADATSTTASTTPNTTQSENKVASLTVDNQTTHYASLVDAFNAVQNGKTATITLLSDSHGSGLFLKGGDKKNITIDFNNHTYTMDGTAVGSTGTESQSMHFEKENTVTLKNGTLRDTSPSARMIIQNYCNLTLDNFTVDGSTNSNVLYGLSNNNDSVSVNNSTIKVPAGQKAFDICATTHYPDGTQVSISNSQIIGNIEYDTWDGAPETNKVSLTMTDDTVNGNWVIEDGSEDAAKDKFTVVSGSYSDDPSPYVKNASTPEATVTNGNSKTYAVGDATIKEAAQDPDNTVEITQGSIALNGANATIKNASTNTGTVTVDGETLKAGSTKQVGAAQTIANLKNEIASLNSQLAQAQASASSAQNTSNDSARQITQLKKDLADAQAQLKTAQAQAASQGSTLTAPGQVMNLKAKAGKRYVKLSWTALQSNVTGYRVYRKVKGGKYTKVKTLSKADAASWTNKGLKKGKTYYYKVRAYKSITSGELWGTSSNTAKAKVK